MTKLEILTGLISQMDFVTKTFLIDTVLNSLNAEEKETLSNYINNRL